MTMTTEVLPVADDESNDFRAWMRSMGYNAKQVGQAGESIGMAAAMAGRTGRSERDLADTERLAMSAATVGLPAWTPDSAVELDAVRTLYTMLKAELAQSKDSAAEAEAVRTIKALIRSEASRIASERSAPHGQDQETDQAILALLRSAARGTSGH